MVHRFTQEEFEFIDRNAEGRTVAELTAIFNVHFGLDLKKSQIRAFMRNNWICNYVDCRFQPGHVPWNKGKKGVTFGGKATQFKKGNKPANWVPIGSERVNADGYVEIKVADGQKQRNWKGKHIVIWEAANGPVPPDHAVIFGDGNKRNFDPENLILVSRAQLVRLNQRGLIQNNAELTKTGVIIADICNKIGERKRARRGGRRRPEA
ncbi:MAG TPA: HNH endonuclease signature motif containing protein [Bacillota bacterium]|nr:HNH endonuclease signature motif containing protein [Bacillota bacterium]